MRRRILLVPLTLLAAGCVVVSDDRTPPPRREGPPPATTPPSAGLPDCGATPSISGNNLRKVLARGVYTGELRVSGNKLRLVGAGKGETIIRGNLVIDGNSNEVSDLTVEGGVQIKGNSNALQVEHRGRVQVQGNNNRY